MHCFPPIPCRRALLFLGAALLALLPPGTALAQTTLNADAGLDSYYKPDRWVPVQCTITNQGQATRAEIAARFQQGMESGHEYRIPEISLQGSANIRHTLYAKAPPGFAPQSLFLTFYQDGRARPNPVRPRLNPVGEGDWLVVSVGSSETASRLKLLTTAAINNAAPRARPWTSSSNRHQINVAVLDPGKIPDRWQGLEAADMVVLGDVGEREFTPEQQVALRDYVTSGGTLVITGGVNWNRLTTPFYADLLPVRVTGGATVSLLPGLRTLAAQNVTGGRRFALCTSTPKPGSEVRVAQGSMPVVAKARRGSGQVVYVAFDPSLPPFDTWAGLTDFWKRVMADQPPAPILPTLSVAEGYDEYGPYGYTAYAGAQARLAQAPYAISQLDIPAFYIVALFLLAYIIVLVPVNYYILKARDKKEYAWLTTPAIVLLFSVGAYMIGYGFKGGRTLLAKVAVIEARAGQDSAPTLTYAGIFSPRKTSYDIQLAAEDPAGQAEASTTLISEPGGSRGAAPMRVIFGETQKVDDFAVDMWAMRVLKTEGITRLGKGVTAQFTRQGGRFTGTIRNDSPYDLDDCYLVAGNQPTPMGTLAAGRQVTIPGSGIAWTNTSTLPPALLAQVKGSPEQQRMKRAVLQPVCTAAGSQSYRGPVLVGWVRQGVARLRVDGRTPREQSATLMIVHLGGA